MKYLKITDETVAKRTGRVWLEWFKILDEMDAQTLGHALTAKQLMATSHLSAWWAQVVTIRYEKEKGYWRGAHQ